MAWLRGPLRPRLVVPVVAVAVLAGAAVALWQVAASRQPSYCAVTFLIKQPGPPSTEMRPFTETEPIVAEGYWSRSGDDAPLPYARPTWRSGWCYVHPLAIVVKDPDWLVYRWERTFAGGDRPEELRRLEAGEFRVDFSFDLQDWVPEGFRWKTGAYRVAGVATAGGRPAGNPGGMFFMNEVTPGFRQTGPDNPLRRPARTLLAAELESNKKAFRLGEIIVLRGFLRNVSDEPFAVQTRLAFREARLIAEPGRDSFPMEQPSVPLRLSDFTRIEPGQRIALFEETFIAGQVDPHWAEGCRDECLLPPFSAQMGPDYSIWFELRSEGILPEDRQPDVGIWTGRAASNRVTVSISREPEQPPAASP